MVMPPVATALAAGCVVLVVAWILRQCLAPARRSMVAEAGTRGHRLPGAAAHQRVQPHPDDGGDVGHGPALDACTEPDYAASNRSDAGVEGDGGVGPHPLSGSGPHGTSAESVERPRSPVDRPARTVRRRIGLRGWARITAARRDSQRHPSTHRRRWSWPRRRPPVEQHLAEWCTNAARTVRSGVSLPDAVDQATADVQALAPVFAPVQQAQQRGVSLSTALDRVAHDNASVALVVAVVRTCARLGGSAAAPLDRTAAVMHARLTALAERRVQSAQARMSALVMTTTPFAVLALLVALESSVRSSFGLTATWVCLTVGVFLNVVGWTWMRRIIRSAESPRTRPWSCGPTAAQLALPDGVELLVCCLHAGLSPPQLIDAVGTDLPPALQPAFDAVRHQLQRGHRFADALGELPKVIGPDAHSVADSIAAADRYGLPLAPVLERLAAEAVDTRRRLGEIAARKLPVRLSFPLVGTVLPAFVLIALAPAVIGAVSTLRIA